MPRPSRKRVVEEIDLTGDDDVQILSSRPSSQTAQSSKSRPPKHARTSDSRRPTNPSPRSSYQGSSQAYPYTLDDDEDEEDGAVEAPELSQNYNDVAFRYERYGVLATKIVGVRYYSGVATVGEMVVLQREPHNPYDANAIQVQNVQRAQIGHIPRTMAAKLARYMDSRSLLIEGYITGRKEAYDCPIELRLYGTSEPVERRNLIVQMKSDRLPVGDANTREREQAMAEKERQKMLAQAAKAAKKNSGAVVGSAQGMQWENGMGEYAAGSSQGLGLGPSMDDIIGGSERFNPRNIEQMAERFGIKEEDLAKMPMAEQPKGLLAQLHPFQRQGLKWMLDKESPQLPSAGSKDVVQLWTRHLSEANTFTNLATNYSIKNQTPELASGGILADDMGLGKTLQVISLILADKALKGKAAGVSGATLILAPVSVMSNWSSQMKKHIHEEHALRVMFYHGTRKQPINPKEIGNYDIVISTYDTVSSEWWSQKNPTAPRKDGVFSVQWRRVVLDEGHSIRNPSAKRTCAAMNLLAQSRWVLTGTPIINTLKDLFSLVKFLRLSGGLDRFELFHGAIIRPVNQGDNRGNFLLQLLMSGICLRRKKEMSFIDLRLPELSEYVHRITFLPHEKEKYDALEAQAKGTLDTYRSRSARGGVAAAAAYRHLLEILLRLRQTCNHWKLVGEARFESIMEQLEEQGSVDLTPENKAALQAMLQLSIDSQDDCPVCLEVLTEPVITRCAHVFCLACIERVVDTQHKCPMCRAEMESIATTVVKPAKEAPAPPPPTQAELAAQDVEDSGSSSKVEALMSILKASQKDPSKGNKTIVFSQWTSFLDILEPHLRAAGINFTRIDGSMPASARDRALEALDFDPVCTVMLASLAVCSVGLNLVAANQVIMADSWWAPAIEDQAVDRVHRLGQKRETTVFRLVMEGSVEENVLRIQEEKRRLMGLAFAEKEGGRKKRAGRGLADVERLLG
ncbi:uncharacterized protein K441DRAFT_694830 [Cenococcum geophilum 1.58]|uniref:uncharacterized protein n=1 Tax=Cenococcum geophilum 1.58 TaxID=794803 RepID=UPI00358ECBCA|nr:hypothetical protein K441DRAFT_694830 [Cenococcum geophilum 1.58]